MSNFTILLSIGLILLFLYACTGGKVEGDIHPDIPLLPASQSKDLDVIPLPHITTLQYAPDGNIHAIGRLPEDTTAPKRLHKYLFIYSPTFELIDTKPITEYKKGIAFVDPNSNVYIRAAGDQVVKYSYPNYEKIKIHPHPISVKLNTIAAKELRPSKRSPTSKEYHQLKKEGKEEVIKQNQKEVAQALQKCYEEDFNLDAIDYGILYSGQYVLFMKDGQQYTLKNYQGMNGKSSLSSFLKKQQKIIIYKNYNREDKGYSIANMMLKEKQQQAGSNLQKRLVETDFAISEKKSTLENWPNAGYTRGFYYYQLNFDNATAVFKVENNIKSKNKVRVFGKEKAPICFLTGQKGWFLVQPK